MRHCIALIAAVLFGVGVLVISAPTSSAFVQTPPSEDVMNEQQVREFRSYLDKTNSADEVTRSRWRNIFSRSMPKALPALAGTLLEGGLFTAAAGIWYHDAVAFKTGILDAGKQQVLGYDAEFKPPAGAISGEFVGPPGYYWGPGTYARGAVVKATGGEMVVTAVILADVQYSSGQYHTFVADYYSTPGQDGGIEVLSNSYPDPYAPLRGKRVTKTVGVAGSTGPTPYRIRWSPGGATVEIPPGYDVTQDYQPGAMIPAAPEYTPGEGDYVAQPSETKKLYDTIKADPEYNPQTDAPASPETWEQQHERRTGVLAPDHAGQQGDTVTNPDGSKTTRFGDGTELTTWPDGTELTRTPDGVEHWKYPDGTEQTYDPKTGERVTTYPDGTVHREHFNPSNPPLTNPDSTVSPDTQTWTDPTGQTEPAPDSSKYPDPNTSSHTNPDVNPTNPDNYGGGQCKVIKGYKFDLPKLELFNVFPFSLVLKAWNVMQSLVAPPERPVFRVPLMGDLTVSDGIDQQVQVIKTAISVVMFVGMLFWFWRMVTGRGSDGDA